MLFCRSNNVYNLIGNPGHQAYQGHNYLPKVVGNLTRELALDWAFLEGKRSRLTILMNGNLHLLRQEARAQIPPSPSATSSMQRSIAPSRHASLSQHVPGCRPLSGSLKLKSDWLELVWQQASSRCTDHVRQEAEMETNDLLLWVRTGELGDQRI